jgi:ankyrin repeat protein
MVLIVLLIIAGTDANLVNNDGNKALILACGHFGRTDDMPHWNGHSLFPRLLDGGADMGTKNSSGKTALQIAEELKGRVAIDQIKTWIEEHP